MNPKVLCALLCIATVASGAAAPSAASEADTRLAEQWRALSQSGAPLTSSDDAAIDHSWWQRFGDPVLEALVSEALRRNNTLQIARSRVAEARVGRRGAEAALLPAIEVGGAQAAAMRVLSLLIAS